MCCGPCHCHLPLLVRGWCWQASVDSDSHRELLLFTWQWEVLPEVCKTWWDSGFPPQSYALLIWFFYRVFRHGLGFKDTAAWNLKSKDWPQLDANLSFELTMQMKHRAATPWLSEYWCPLTKTAEWGSHFELRYQFQNVENLICISFLHHDWALKFIWLKNGLFFALSHFKIAWCSPQKSSADYRFPP